MIAMRALACLLLLGGCSSAVEPHASALVCDNDPLPAASAVAFRVVYSTDLVRPDTTPGAMNRLVVPYRYQDTVTTLTNQGGAMRIIFSSASPTTCITLMDSLAHHLPNARGIIFP